MLISDVLQGKGRDVVTVETGARVQDVLELLSRRKIGAVVVLQAGRPTGIFSERDLLNALAKSGSKCLQAEVSELMTSPIVTGHLDDRIEAAMQMMTRRRIRHLPVVEGEKLVGLVSIGDLVKHRLDEKELEANVMLDLSRMRS